ncbi:MAG: glutamine--fructose-6-phosphate transaminase (isomerizing), partial [Patescibacteria group bacterium]
IRERLRGTGHTFTSQTDTEVLAHLIEHEQANGGSPIALKDAVAHALSHVRGAYGLALVSADNPNEIIVARLGSPLVIGVGKDEWFVASDPSAILSHSRQVVYLDDGELCVLGRNGYSITRLDMSPVEKHVEQIDWSVEDVQKNGQAHFMLKEMLEGPEVLVNTMRGRLNVEEGTAVLGGLRDVADRLRTIDRLIIVGCGSARLAGMVGKYMLEEYAGIPVEVEIASEFRYRQPVLTETTAVLAISQSGETADTLAAIREAKMKGVLTLGIVNTVGSSIARETDAGVYNHAGPEIGVASTKAFLSQMVVLAMFAIFLGRQRRMSVATGQRIAKELTELPELLQRILDNSASIKTLAERWAKYEHFFFLGRKYCTPVACEGALKLKEISYIHAEAYAAGEMKHGPIALIDANFPSVVICPKDSVYEKTRSNIEEIRARGGKVIALTTEGNETEMAECSDDVITIPKTLEMLTPILATAPLHLFAYYVALARNCDPDKPRNLAKSVTVE